MLLRMVEYAVKKFEENNELPTLPNELKYYDAYTEKREFRVRVCEPAEGKKFPIIYVDYKDADTRRYKQISHGWLKSHGPEIMFGKTKGE